MVALVKASKPPVLITDVAAIACGNENLAASVVAGLAGGRLRIRIARAVDAVAIGIRCSRWRCDRTGVALVADAVLILVERAARSATVTAVAG